MHDLPVFERWGWSGPVGMTRIGAGGIGGKATGLASIRDALAREFPAGEIEVGVPTLAVIGTDFFDEFIGRNKLDRVLLDQHDDQRIAQAFQRAELPVELVGDLRALVQQVHTPLAVRSSSRLEDALERPFAGVYATKMIPNNAHDADTRFRRLLEAVKFVYASTFFAEARAYLAAAGQPPGSEQMAVIIQDVVGQRRGPRFYPELAGVARSYNFYPAKDARPEDGVVQLALGLGKTIVDGGLSWSYSPAQPARTPPFGSIDELLNRTQTRFWAVDMETLSHYDPVSEAEFLVEAGLREAEDDGSLRYVASTYDPSRDRIMPGIGPSGPRVINAAPLLVHREFPLNDLLRALMAAAERHTGAKVEIEFALTIATPRDAPPRARLGFLQVRPLAVSNAVVELDEAALTAPEVLLASTTVMGNGVEAGLRDVVYVKPKDFDPVDTPRIASEIETINRALVEAGTRYVLIGFGRWGSSHPSLGIPVNWSQIAGAAAIVETTLPAMNVEPSQGSHFFHNLSAFRVGYFTLHHEGRFAVDWNWLDSQPAVTETAHVRHVRTGSPLEVVVDGRTGRGLVRRSGA